MLLLLGFISPTVRGAVIGIGRLLPFILFAAVALLVGFLVAFKYFRKSLYPEDTVGDNGARVPTSRSGVLIEVSAPAPETSPAPANLVVHLRKIDWFQFEKLIEIVYRKLGYLVTRRGGANPDGGIDLIIEKDGLKTAVQCKHWKKRGVGVAAVRQFAGALQDAKIQSGVFVTLNGYTGEAKSYAERNRLEIINESGLVQMLEQVAASSDAEIVSLLNDERKFCPKCEREMRLKTARTGRHAGEQFWACSGFPKCWFKMDVS